MSNQQPAHNIQSTGRLGDFWTLANALSLARLVLVWPITYLILANGPLAWLFGLIAVAAVTDFFDGRVARWSHTVSEWGKVLDPLADKVAAALIVTALVMRDAEPNLPGWFLALVLFRDVGIIACSILLAKRTGRIIMSAWAGKVAVTALALTCMAALLRADAPVLNVCVWTTAGLLLYSQGLYLLRFFSLMRARKAPAPADQDATRQNPSARPVEQEANSLR